MANEKETKKHLINELSDLRRKISELETLHIEHKRVEKELVLYENLD